MNKYSANSGHVHPQNRRGVALLLVLAILLLVMTSAVALARAASLVRADARVKANEDMAVGILSTADDIIQHWLRTESAKVVLEPEVTQPKLNVLDDIFVLEDIEMKLRITAWDQSGISPLEELRKGSPLRLAAPSDVLEIVDSVEPDSPLGLDQFFEELQGSVKTNVFPKTNAGQTQVFFTNEAHTDVNDAQSFPSDNDSKPAVGSNIATHNPGSINVQTAPLALIEQALRMNGRGGLDVIAQARAAGRPVPLGNVPLPEDRSRGQRAIQLVTTSTVWSFRIDIDVNGLQRSWWAIYQKQSGWRCIQRLVIHE